MHQSGLGVCVGGPSNHAWVEILDGSLWLTASCLPVFLSSASHHTHHTHACTDSSYTSPLSPGVLWVSAEAGTWTHTPQMTYLWADVAVTSANLIEPAETHHFTWRFLFFGLALICWWLPALWLGRGVSGRGGIVSHADSVQTQQPPPPYAAPSDTPGWAEVSQRFQL